MKKILDQIEFVKRNWMHVILWIGVLILFFPVLRQVYCGKWTSLNYDHAYFILPVSIFLIWRIRKELFEIYARRKAGISFSCVLLFAVSVWMYVFGWKWGYMFVCMAAFIPATGALTGLIYGLGVLKRVWFSFFYLIFMIPPPASMLDSITLPMQYVSSSIAYRMLGTAGYNVVKNGLLITINDFSIVVGNACSGFRSFITLTVLGLLYIYFYASKERLSYKVILLGLIPILAIVGNSLRICCIGLLGYHFGQEVADGFLHSFSGMLVFVFMIMGLFLADLVMGKVFRRVKDIKAKG